MATKLEHVDSIIALRDAAETLRNGYSRHRARVEDDQRHPRIDKYAFKFTELDECYSAWQAKIQLTAYEGVSGNSSVYTVANVDSKLATHALIAYLNAHKESVLSWMADYVDNEADSKIADAQAEIQRVQDILAAATKVKPSPSDNEEADAQ